MVPSKGITRHAVQSKLRIFVSSRLQECSDERKVARAAINQIRHTPVLFEHVGARPYPARELYLSELRASQIMVAFYRDGYGYIDDANGMHISGLEDEFRYARDLKIDTIFYILRSSDSRDQRLQVMIDDASSRSTLSYYSTADELHDRVADDITAVITEKYLGADFDRNIERETADELLTRSTEKHGPLVTRPYLLTDAQSLLEKNYALCINGPPGIGKTTFAAQLSELIKATYVRLTGLTPKEIFAVLAQILRAGDPQTITFSTLEGARLSFAAQWVESSHIRLVIDECEYIDELRTAIEAAGGLGPEKLLVFTSRDAIGETPNLTIPPLTTDEGRQILGGASPETHEMTRLLERGNPLALQRELATLEFDRGSESRAHSNELVSYLALSELPLTAAQMIALVGNDGYSIEQLYKDLEGLGRLIDDSPRGLRIMHAESARSIRDELNKTPQRLRFYAGRLVRLFESESNFRAAYIVASLVPDQSNNEILMPALRQAAELGDWKLGERIAANILQDASDNGRKLEAFQLFLSLVYPLEVMGKAGQALAFIERAREYATSLGEDAKSILQEIELLSRARRTLALNDVSEVEKIQERYGSLGAMHDQARILIELSAMYMGAKSFERGSDAARKALMIFRNLGDEYGVDIAERNLASSLSALSDNEEEVEQLISRIAARNAPSDDTRRQRAWHINILTRRFRQSGRYAEAEELANEALGIADELGDASLKALNLVNLGNIYVDQKRYDEAITAYQRAGAVAQQCARRDIEADSSRLQARVFNQLPMDYIGYPDRRDRAKHLAEHAVGLLSGTVYHSARGHAFDQLGNALYAMKQTGKAGAAFFNAATEYALIPDEEDIVDSLLAGTSTLLPAHPEIYVKEINSFLGLTHADQLDVSEEEGLANQFLKLFGIGLRKLPLPSIVPLLGMHLQTIRKSMPPLLKSVLAERCIAALSGLIDESPVNSAQTRLLFGGLLTAFLLKDDSRQFLHKKLSETVSKQVSGLDVREIAIDDSAWTIVLELDVPVTISLTPLDESQATTLAIFALGFFLKAFETDIRDNLVSQPVAREIVIHVGDYSAMPADLRNLADEALDVRALLDRQACAVTRPTSYEEETPTLIILGPKFLNEANFGEGVGGSFQVLLGLTTVEILHALLQGEVNLEELEPKITSLIRKTIS
jgi:tetratricopeptide (TPR) repeat protein